jgi:hypothetical protein
VTGNVVGWDASIASEMFRGKDDHKSRFTENVECARLLAERGSLEDSTCGPLSRARDNLLPLIQAEPGYYPPLFRPTNTLDKTPLVLVLFDHANCLTEPDGELVTQRWDVKSSHDHQSGARRWDESEPRSYRVSTGRVDAQFFCTRGHPRRDSGTD